MSNFICDKCGMTNIDCGRQGYKTEREIELEKQLDREIHINRKMKKALKQIASENDCYLTIADKVLKEIDNKE